MRRPAKYFYRNNMETAGIGRTMKWSKAYNRWRYASRRRQHQRLYDTAFDELLLENGYGDTTAKNNVMRDGWALDESMTLPHLDELLAETGPLIDERGGIKDPKRAYGNKPFFQTIRQPEDVERYKSFLDFPMSSEILETIGRYMGTIPVLSKTMPPGIRFVESYAAYEDEPDPPYRESQFYHLDIHDLPLVYMIVLLREVTMEHGPWCFLPASVSARAAKAMNYRQRGAPYRITDEEMYKHVDPSEMIPLIGPPGTVLFIDSGRCFHYGSRNSVKPRYMMMYGFTTPCRTDLTMTYMTKEKFPIDPSASRLRRMVLE
ncbi:MAG: hypothetical protein GC159_18010 [Phycisphaera sp.]|nr:hypothetical protein [Phycisphaera sp.]